MLIIATLFFGILIGVSLSTVVVTVLIYFRNTIEQQITAVESGIQSAGPQPKGYIIEPPDEATEIRKQVIKQNSEKGQDTPMEGLY